MYNLRFILTMLLLFVMVAASDYGEAASPINIKWSADSAVYSISTTDLPDASGMDLSITYDKAALKEPQVRSGTLLTGATMLANTSTSGFIRIGIMTGGVIKGTGELVSVSFTKTGKGPASQPVLSPVVYSTDYSQLAVQPTTTASQPAGEGTVADGAINNSSATTATSGGGTAGTGIVTTTPNPNPAQVTTSIGSVTLPQETDVKSDLLRPDNRKEGRREEPLYTSVPENQGVVAALSREAAVAAVPEAGTAVTGAPLKSIQSVPDRFRVDKGGRTLKRLSSLFDQSELRAAGIVQSPAIVVTDGKSIVTITVEMSHEVDTPSFSLKGANLKSIKRVSDRKWELGALPQKGKADVRLSILLKGGHTEIPLVAVPPISKAGAELTALPDAALEALLAKPLKNNKPSYDLNSDGRQDHLDDYILVGHWLLKQQSAKGAGGKPAAAGK